MAERWESTRANRLLLASLDVLARVSRRRLSPVKAGVESTRVVRRILVVELWNIGDVVLTLPFLIQLRALFPDASVTMLARPYAREILGGTGLVDDFIETDLGWRADKAQFNPFRYRWRELRRITAKLRRRKFDIAFKARMHVREHLLLGLSAASRTVAPALGVGDSLLTDPIRRLDCDLHKVEDWLALLAPFGGPIATSPAQLVVTTGEKEWADRYLRERGISANDRIVGIHPGASLKEKRWPIERFAEVAKSLGAKPQIRVVAFADTQGYGAELGKIEGVTLATVGLRQMIALIQRCYLLVCNDSGPMHIAGALGVPVVAVFGSGIRRWFEPLGEGHELLQPDDFVDAAKIDTVRRNQAGTAPADRGFGVGRVEVDAVLIAIEKAMARR